jgi:hypothetical protein
VRLGLDQRRASGGDEIVGYKPIESYGVIGDLHTVALVGIDDGNRPAASARLRARSVTG